MSKLKKFGTRFPGVRYYEHHERKHKGKPDRYFSIRYMMHKKQKEEGLGWASQGMTDSQAMEILSALKKAHRISYRGQFIHQLNQENYLKKMIWCDRICQSPVIVCKKNQRRVSLQSVRR